MDVKYWVASVLLVGSMDGVRAQQAPAELLARLQAQASTYEAHLPSLECRERIVSQELKKDEVKREVVVEGQFRLKRQDSGKQPFLETHQYESVNGKELPAGKKPQFPVFFDGGFANGPGLFLNEKKLHCFRFEQKQGTRGQQELWVSRKDIPNDTVCSSLPKGVTGKVRIDVKSGQIDYVEVGNLSDEAKARKIPLFAAVEFGPIALGGEIYWLPVRLEALPSQNNLRFVATYSDFKLYGASITVLPGVEKVPDPLE